LTKRVGLENPGPAVSDGDGGTTQTWTACSPSPVWASIVPATVRDLEKVVAATVLATVTHLVTMRYHPQVTTQTRVIYGTRIFNVTGVVNSDEDDLETVALCAEVVS
jgi:SPP1 family predicted phage head-tail adaptor